MKNLLLYILCISSFCLLQACKKFLDVKSDDQLALISKTEDLQMILDQYSKMNESYPWATEVQADNYVLNLNSFNGLSSDSYRNLYTWTKDEFHNSNRNGGTLDYTRSFAAILEANLVLTEGRNIVPKADELIAYNNAIGSAYFFRAYWYLGLSQLYIRPYNSATSKIDLGLPLREDPDFNGKSIRSTVEQTYQFIVSDLKKSINLLPILPSVKSRPSKPAAYGALAKVYLYMNDFTNSKLYADSCLALYSDLIDYNTLNKNAPAPFARFNKEVIFQMRSVSINITASPLRPTRAIIASQLFNSYNDKDLRKPLFYRLLNGTDYVFKGDYDGRGGNNSGYVFAGITTDETYLIRAEGRAMTGDIDGALEDLNKLLVTRWEVGSYVPLIANTEELAMKLIIQERRKELVYRGARWSDIRRLSGPYQIVPERILGDKTYTLDSGNPRYVMPFPIEVIQKSGMEQNP